LGTLNRRIASMRNGMNVAAAIASLAFLAAIVFGVIPF